ncbi:uncharacterized protein LOC120536188 isoform X2 [Polypterus senegalus]|nr:uncharacterized protein LOC120536188 isoform X2 [Polypterus senegalus]
MVASNHWEQSQVGSFFLFHNGKKVKSETVFGGKRTAMFTLESIVAEQAGRYECAYGTKSPDRLGDFQTNNSVSIRVKECQVLLILQVQSLTEGVEVTFTCSFPKDSKIKSSSGGSFQLRRDGELLSKQSADTSPEVTFRIQHTSENKNGIYVCVFRKGDAYTVKSQPVRLQDKAKGFSSKPTVDNTSSSQEPDNTNATALYMVGGAVLLILLVVTGGIAFYVTSKRVSNADAQMDPSSTSENADSTLHYSELQHKARDTSISPTNQPDPVVYSQITRKTRTYNIPLHSLYAEITGH